MSHDFNEVIGGNVDVLDRERTLDEDSVWWPHFKRPILNIERSQC